MSDRYLIIPDLQIPFQLRDALDFTLAAMRFHKIPRDNAVCVGDETDGYWASHYDKDPDAKHSAVTELDEAVDELKRWYSAFPRMRVCNSNHQARWGKRAAISGIPSRIIRPYRDVIEAPAGWQWADEWIIPTARPFLVEHGHTGAQRNQAPRRCIDNAMSTVQGHEHGDAGTRHFQLKRQKLWWMNVGCLMDTESYAAAYGKGLRTKPVLSCGVVLDNGKTPMVVPHD